VPWLLDGNNLVRGGDREAVRRAALAVARHERVRILIFFDGAPPAGVGATERLGRVETRYTGHADTAILAFLQRGGREWRVATDDRELGGRARAAGAEVVPAASFWHKAQTAAQASESQTGAVGDVVAELDYFADERHRLPESSTRVARRSVRPRRRKALE
jgi:hypothetical protein